MSLDRKYFECIHTTHDANTSEDGTFLQYEAYRPLGKKLVVIFLKIGGELTFGD